LPLQIKFMTSGSKQGIVAFEDGLADIACVSSVEEQDIPEGLALIRGYTRELGLMSRDPGILIMEGQKAIGMVGWPRNSEMSRISQAALRDAGIDPGAVCFAGTVRTHYAVAAAVASERAQLGFGARMAAESAGLCFRKSVEERMDFLVARSSLKNDGLEMFIFALKSEDLWQNLPPGISMDKKVRWIL
jgi:molybdate-binding protein